MAASWSVYLTIDGVQLGLSSGLDGIYILDYTPRTPELQTSFDQSAMRDGGRLSSAAYRDVTETCRVAITGTATQIQTDIDTIQRGMVNARARSLGQRGHTVKKMTVHVAVSDTGYDAVYESEILGGSVQVDQDFLDLGLKNGVVEADLIWTRRYYWEGPSASLTLANDYGTTTPNRIYAEQKAAAQRSVYVRITGSDIKGHLPAPVTLDLYNQNTGVTLGEMWAMLGIQLTSSTWPYVLEGEAALSGGAVTSDTSATADAYITDTWSGQTEQGLINWQLDTNAMTALAGTTCKAILKLTGNPGYTDLRIRPSLLNRSTSDVIALGQQVLAPTSGVLIDLGVMKIPPLIDDPAIGHYALDLWLNVQRDALGTHTLTVDALYVAPINTTRRYVPRVGGINAQTGLYDDGEKVWTFTSRSPFAGALENYRAYGAPLLLYPGKDMRLTVIFARSNKTVTVDDYMDIQLTYRPRYLVI